MKIDLGRTGHPRLALFLLAAALIQAPSLVPAQQMNDVTAIVNVNVIPMDAERLLEEQTVLVRGDRIAALGPAATLTIPEGAHIIDGAGHYLIPGLADMHFHLDDELTRLALAVANGVTTVQSLNTEPDHLVVAAEIGAGDRFGPRIITGPHAVGLPPRTDFAYRRVNRAVAPFLSLEAYLNDVGERPVRGFQVDAESARRFVRWAHDAGGDFIKTNLLLSREAFDALAETAGELGMKVQGHVWGDIGLEHYIASGGQVHHTTEIAPYLSENGVQGVPTTAFDLRLVDERLPGLISLMREHGMTFTPTVDLMWFVDRHFRDYQGVSDNPQLRYAPPQLLQVLRDPDRNPVFANYGRDDANLAFTEAFQAFQARLVRELHAAGVPLLAGTDALEVLGMVYGFALHRELELFVEYGLTPYQALETATRNPAVFWGEQAEWGTVAVGKRADLVLLDANPLGDITHTRRIAGVMLRGRWLPQTELQAMLDGIAADYEARAAESVEHEPFSNELFAIRGVAPAGWRELEPGLYTRSDPDRDPTFLFQLSAPVGEIGELVQEWLARFEVADTLPEPVATVESDAFSWNLYNPETPLPLTVALALTDSAERVYAVVLVAPQDELDALAESVFMPAVMALAPTE